MPITAKPGGVSNTLCAGLATATCSDDGAKNIAIFTSGGTISAICQHVLGFPDPRFAELNWSLVNSAVTRLHVQTATPERPVRLALAYLNNFSHLEVLNNPKSITYV
jgi:broad specificity phosphatase PhoE